MPGSGLNLMEHLAGENVGTGSSHVSGMRSAGCLGRAKEEGWEAGKLCVQGLFGWVRLGWVRCFFLGGEGTVECSPVNETAQAQMATKAATEAAAAA